MSIRTTTAAFLAAAMGLSLCVGFAPADAPTAQEVKLEDAGTRRQAKDDLTLKPFDAALWGKLEGTKIDPESIKGKPVLLVTWSSWYKASHTGLTLAQKLADKYAKDGLVVIGVHHQQGFDKAAEIITQKKVTFASTHDASGAWREALYIDQDPDFYVIDRAGQLRYADVATQSVEDAVSGVVSETAEQAAAIPVDLAAAAATAEANKWKTGDAGVLPGTYHKPVAFELPDSREYDKVAWPEHNKGDLKGELDADNFQGKSLPAEFGPEEYVKGNAPDRKGRVVVVWMCEINLWGLSSWFRMFDDLQNEFGGDVTVIAIAHENLTWLRRFSTNYPVSFALASDMAKTMHTAFKVKENMPYVAVLSTDGVVRWQSNMLYVTSRDLQMAAERVIKVDPGVKARRDAEKADMEKEKKK